MDEVTYTSRGRASYRAKPCPECGKTQELGWIPAGRLDDTDRWMPNEKCRNPQCSLYRNPNSLGGG